MADRSRDVARRDRTVRVVRLDIDVADGEAVVTRCDVADGDGRALACAVHGDITAVAVDRSDMDGVIVDTCAISGRNRDASTGAREQTRSDVCAHATTLDVDVTGVEEAGVADGSITDGDAAVVTAGGHIDVATHERAQVASMDGIIEAISEEADVAVGADVAHRDGAVVVVTTAAADVYIDSAVRGDVASVDRNAIAVALQVDHIVRDDVAAYVDAGACAIAGDTHIIRCNEAVTGDDIYARIDGAVRAIGA
ncbi:MAG: hypothetical protein EBX50_18120 [Chitinophagia bacterium]|nr:hypothetical protein [Chitinophagia bacterium]